ncbi:vacuolar protein sorting-associated protein 18 dor isoform X3 [Tachypleus tridentatus]|uniref:vacuolar protein sorting-associated protein 18 dor isoform X3 n=3 Tax=Tachypleus tridentatus TaxID=6853 RepID=UPI003FD539F5
MSCCSYQLLAPQVSTGTTGSLQFNMASLFEQYEQAASISTGPVTSIQSLPELTTAGFINARLEEETPIFKKQRINFSPTDAITHLTVSNNQLVLAMKNKCLLRINLLQPDQPDEIELLRSLGEKNSSVRIYQMFLDLSGKHLLVSFVSTDTQGPFDNFYLWKGSRKVQQASKMKGQVISAVAWNFENTNESTTGSILLGTTKGLIFETELACQDEQHFFQKSPEQYWKQLFEICNGSSQQTAITGLEFHKMSSSFAGDNKYFIMVTTASRLYQFLGSVPSNVECPVLQHVFNNYPEVPDRFLEIPGQLGYSKLQLFYPQPGTLPETFGWMTEPGVYYGTIDTTGQAGHDSVTVDTQLIHYPEVKGNLPKNPISFVLTKFHTLVLYPDRLKALCVLNEQLVFEDVFTEMYGSMVGITKDPMKDTIWAFSEMAVYRYRITKEERYVWEVYLDKEEYELAKHYCKNDPQKLDKVLSKQADDYYSKKRFKESATLYAQTHKSFEEVSLKFLQVADDDALKLFLKKKMEGLKSQDKAQTTMIIMWLLEIYLNQLGCLRNAERQNTDQYKSIQAIFHSLLEQPRVKECVGQNCGAIYNLIASHGDEENLIHFTVLMKDYERVIQYHLQNNNFQAALDVLTKQSRSELFYQFSPVLMQSIPKKTVDAWISLGHKLNPAKLIPALVQYDNSKDPKQEESMVSYDLKYALRLCSEVEENEACVHIYTTMGLYEEAVDLALKFDVQLAKRNADRPEDNEELRKKLWLKIAKHVVKEENDIKKAMEFLQECDLIKIEDILPFFPDFVTIDHFKDAICSSLDEYNTHIDSLKDEMEEATQSAGEIRTEIQTFRNKHTLVKAQEKCSACFFPVMTRAFYLFPCQHMFHMDCLIAEVITHLITTKRHRVEEIQRQLVAMTGRDDATSLSSVSGIPGVSAKEKLKMELDDLIASECLYCGDIMIRSVDAPFIDPEEYTEAMQGWE